MPTTEIYADTRGVATCRGPNCGQKILWAEVVRTGKALCFNLDQLVALKTRYDGAHRLIETVDLEHTHWRTCPDADLFRR